jgi:hypothetical protein
MVANNVLSRKNFWVIVMNSTAAFVISYLFIFYLNHFSIIFTAGMFDHDISFDFSQIHYHVIPTDWTHDSVKVIYGTGPLLVFITGILSLLAYSSLSEETEKIKILLLWLTIHAFNFVFSGIIIGIIFKIRIAHLFIWMYMNDSQLLMMAMLAFFGILVTGLLMARKSAFSANSYFNKLDEQNFPFFIMAQSIVPFVFGTLILLIYFIPEIQITETYNWIGLGLIILINALIISNYDAIYFDEDEKEISGSRSLVITTILIMLLLRIALNKEILIAV